MTRFATALKLLLLCILASCASTRILEREDGNFVVIATGYSQGASYDAAAENAQEHCEQMGKKFLLVNETSESPRGTIVQQTVNIGNTFGHMPPQNPQEYRLHSCLSACN